MKRMEKKFENITRIDASELYDEAMAYVDTLINEATANGSLSEPDADNEYTREIGRIGGMCADHESLYYKAKSLKFPISETKEIKKEIALLDISDRIKDMALK